MSPIPKKAARVQDTLEFHPLANAFPLMEGTDFKGFVADIKANGLREPITMFEDKILEGRNRYRACLRLKIEPRFEQFEGDEAAAAAFVMSRNIHRRHLTPKQKREAVAKLLKLHPEKSDREIGTITKTDHKTVGAVRGEKEATGEIPQLKKTVGKDGRSRPTKKKATDTRRRAAAPSKPEFIHRAEAAQEEEQRAERLAADKRYAEEMVAHNSEAASWMLQLLRDDERRTVFAEALAIAIRSAAAKHIRELMGGTAGNDADATASNDIDATASAETRKAHFAAAENKESEASVVAAAQSAEPAPTAPAPTEPPLQSSAEAPPSNSNIPTAAIGQWQIKPKKYVNGWSWFATDGSVSLNSNPAALFATQEEAEADARAVIAGAGQLQPSAITKERSDV